MLRGFSKENGYGEPWERCVAVGLGGESLRQLLA